MVPNDVEPNPIITRGDRTEAYLEGYRAGLAAALKSISSQSNSCSPHSHHSPRRYPKPQHEKQPNTPKLAAGASKRRAASGF